MSTITEKTIIKIGVIALFAVLLNSACTKRTPENILKQQFNITLTGFDYKVETFEEQWNPNGDGYVFIVFKFNEITQSNINYLKSSGFKELPISQSNVIPDRLLFDKGYYLFENENKNDERDFKLFIVDTEKNKAILYYQYM